MTFIFKRSALGAFKRTLLGVRLIDEEPPEPPGIDSGVIMLGMDDLNSRHDGPPCPPLSPGWIYNLWLLGDLSALFPGASTDYTIHLPPISDTTIASISVNTQNLGRDPDCGGATGIVTMTAINPTLSSLPGGNAGVPGPDGPLGSPLTVTFSGPGGPFEVYNLELCDVIDETATTCNPIRYFYTSPTPTP